jgi:hypothetical protein
MAATVQEEDTKTTDSVEITLKYPLKSADKLTMRRVKVRDSLAAQKIKGSDAEQEIFLFANLCEVTTRQIEALDMQDYKQLQETYSGFLS